MNKKFIIPECYLDTFLIDVLGFGKQNHQKGITKVVSTLKNKYADLLGVGFIDSGIFNPELNTEFELIKEEDYLVLYKHKSLQNYLIDVMPGLEQWLLQIIDSEGLNLADFSLPANLKEFKKIVKDEDVHKNENIKNLLYTLKRRNVKPFQTITDWINEIKN